MAVVKAIIDNNSFTEQSFLLFFAGPCLENLSVMADYHRTTWPGYSRIATKDSVWTVVFLNYN